MRFLTFILTKVTVIGPAPSPSMAKRVLQRNLLWLIPLLKAAFAWDVVTCFQDLFTQDIPRALKSRTAVKNTVFKDRWFQFGLK